MGNLGGQTILDIQTRPRVAVGRSVYQMIMRTGKKHLMLRVKKLVRTQLGMRKIIKIGIWLPQLWCKEGQLLELGKRQCEI